MMNEIMIKTHTTIYQAMETLDRTAKKVLLVIDDNNKLLGTLTDGDLRRYILKYNNKWQLLRHTMSSK